MKGGISHGGGELFSGASFFKYIYLPQKQQQKNSMFTTDIIQTRS